MLEPRLQPPKPPVRPRPRAAFVAAAKAKAVPEGQSEPPARPSFSMGSVFEGDRLQTIFYLIFMFYLATFVRTLRQPEEYFLSKRIEDHLLGDALDSVALISDIYAWGEERLLPGLLPEFGPDGESSPTVEELLYELDQTDWSGGILIRQVRAPARPNTNKHTIRAKANSAEEAQCAMAEAPICYLDVITDQTPPGTQPFGRNTTHPTEPMVRPFEYWSGEQLGVSPIKSSNVASFRMIPAGGYAAFIIPFFSDIYLPEQSGEPEDVIDFRRHTTSGFYRDAGFFNCSTEACAPQYFCVRLSHNGRHLHQLCDPNEDVDLYSAGPSGPASRTTGVVRRAILDFWRQLRRSQYIDRASRAVAISFQIDANLAAVSSFTTVLFELTAAGSVLVSTDMAVTPNQIDDTVAYGRGALTTFCVYQLFELAELYRFGFFGYLGSLYNLIDAASILVFVSISIRLHGLAAQAHEWLDSELWNTAGFYHNYDYPHACVSLRTWLAVLLCLQLMKTTRFFVALAPKKFGLANRVLAVALVDLVAFGTYFMLSLCAFAMLFFVQLGSRMPGFNGELTSFLTLIRALFGDFDIAEIIQVSSGLTNACLFLIYLFVAVFVLLSMFLAILGEAQGSVREQEAQQREAGSDEHDLIEIGLKKMDALRRREAELLLRREGSL